MDEYEPITGELRGACRESDVYHVMSDTVDRTVIFDGDRFDGLCDNIDAVHAQLERDYARVKAERDSMAAALDAAQGEHAYAPESHYMMLPKDADGVPIHVGDWITGRWDAKAKVVAVTSDDVYWWEPDGCHWCHAFEVRHHVPDTWERIIMDAVCGGDEDELVARCKALAGES